jgi:hypothetical protein
VDRFSFLEKFINPGVFKDVYDIKNKFFVSELFKSSARKWDVKIENIEKKIHGRVKIVTF